MNQQNTIERMKQMRLGAMAQVHYNNLQNNLNMDLTIDQYTSLLVDQEWDNRQGNKIKKTHYHSSFPKHCHTQRHRLYSKSSTG